jgi:sulfur carrier protein ThiS
MSNESNKPNTEVAANTITVLVGVPGNLKSVTLDANNATVKDALLKAELSAEFDAGTTVTVADVLSKAEIKADGQDIRVAGQPANMNSVVTNGQTVLLFRPIAGN